MAAGQGRDGTSRRDFLRSALRAGSRGAAVAAASCAGFPLIAGADAASFDHRHRDWTDLLARHVVTSDGARASRLRYAGMATDRAALRSYGATLSAVSRQAFDGWSPAQQMAFLINAYNAYTVERILTRYPDLASIKDLGSLLSSPWKARFVPLLGQTLSLDDIEHGRLRERGRYDDWRIHFAVNCASVGCPMLREEAFTADRLDDQLDDQERRFVGDRRRNRYDVPGRRLAVSKIFDWYAEDFRLGHRGVTSVPAFFARHADRLADSPADRERIRSAQAPIAFLDYDWALNDSR